MLQVLVMWLHLMAAVFWVGGMLFFSLVLMPSLKDGLVRTDKTALVSRLGRRFRICGWLSLALLLVTGPVRLYQRGLPLEAYGSALRIKMVLVFAMVLLTLLHDFYLGPKSVAMSRAGLDVARFRGVVRWVARFNLLLGLAIVSAAMMLVHVF